MLNESVRSILENNISQNSETGFDEKEINIKQNKFVMDVNYFGVLNCVKSVEKYFKSNGRTKNTITCSWRKYKL